jgi:hypothetical protein
MARYDVEIEGGDLRAARAALNAADIPTIGSGADFPDSGGGRGSGGLWRRFLRSRAFPILLVIVLAFIAQRLISPASDTLNAPSYDQFLAQVNSAPQTIEKVTLDPDDTSIHVDQTNGDEYELGYPPRSEEALVNSLQRQHIETEVESTGGSSLLSLIAYLLPFALFAAFFAYFMRRSREGGQPAAAIQLLDLRAVVEAASPDEADQRVREALPPSGGYRVGKPRAR